MFDIDYDKIQVKDVAVRADVALGTLYRYFNSKDHLFACALQSWSSRFGERFERRASGETVDQVKAVYRRAVRAFDRQPRVYGVMIQVQTSKDPHAVAMWREFAGQQTSAFGLALGSSDLSEEKRRDVVVVMGAVLNESLRRWQVGNLPIADVYTAIDRAADLIFSA